MMGKPYANNHLKKLMVDNPQNTQFLRHIYKTSEAKLNA